MKRIALLLFILSSCTPITENAVESNFDLLEYLKTHKTNFKEFQKIVRIDNQSDTIITKTIDWEKEIKQFEEVNLNKPALRNSFIKTQNANTETYSLKPTEKHAIQSFNIKKEGNTPVQILVDFKSSNLLYNTDKTFELNFKNGFLKSYTIKGTQKLFIGESEKYQVTANLN